MLGSTIGVTSFAQEYTSHKVKDFVEEIENLSQTTERYPPICVCCLDPLYNGKMALHNANNRGY